MSAAILSAEKRETYRLLTARLNDISDIRLSLENNMRKVQADVASARNLLTNRLTEREASILSAAELQRQTKEETLLSQENTLRRLMNALLTNRPFPHRLSELPLKPVTDGNIEVDIKMGLMQDENSRSFNNSAFTLPHILEDEMFSGLLHKPLLALDGTSGASGGSAIKVGLPPRAPMRLQDWSQFSSVAAASAAANSVSASLSSDMKEWLALPVETSLENEALNVKESPINSWMSNLRSGQTVADEPPDFASIFTRLSLADFAKPATDDSVFTRVLRSSPADWLSRSHAVTTNLPCRQRHGSDSIMTLSDPSSDVSPFGGNDDACDHTDKWLLPVNSPSRVTNGKIADVQLFGYFKDVPSVTSFWLSSVHSDDEELKKERLGQAEGGKRSFLDQVILEDDCTKISVVSETEEEAVISIDKKFEDVSTSSILSWLNEFSTMSFLRSEKNDSLDSWSS